MLEKSSALGVINSSVVTFFSVQFLSVYLLMYLRYLQIARDPIAAFKKDAYQAI